MKYIVLYIGYTLAFVVALMVFAYAFFGFSIPFYDKFLANVLLFFTVYCCIVAGHYWMD